MGNHSFFFPNQKYYSHHTKEGQRRSHYSPLCSPIYHSKYSNSLSNDPDQKRVHMGPYCTIKHTSKITPIRNNNKQNCKNRDDELIILHILGLNEQITKKITP